jgi:hypothetical protein
MKLKVAFGIDSTGFDSDIREEVDIPDNTCLFCCHDSNHDIHRLHDVVRQALENKGYDLSYYFSLLKVYTA